MFLVVPRGVVHCKHTSLCTFFTSQAWQLYGLWEALGGSGPDQSMRMPGLRPASPRLQLQIAPDVVMVKDRQAAPRTELIAFKYAQSVH